MTTAKNRDRFLVTLAVVGFLVEVFISIQAAYFQPALLESPMVDGVVVVVAFLIVGALVWWARRPGAPDRGAIVAAILFTAGVITLISTFAYGLGWWKGADYQSMFLVRALEDGMGDASGAALFLLGYRWLADRRPRLARFAYVLLILSFIPAVMFGDWFLLGAGTFVFSGGYTLWHDVLAGQAFGWSPLVIYELVRRRKSVPAAAILKVDKKRSGTVW